MHDPRRQEWVRYTLLELLRQRLYALALGYSAQDDLDRLAHDPALKLAVWDRFGEETSEERLSSQPTQSRLIDLLAQRGNREALRGALSNWLNRWIRAAGTDRRVRSATIDSLRPPTNALSCSNAVAVLRASLRLVGRRGCNLAASLVGRRFRASALGRPTVGTATATGNALLGESLSTPHIARPAKCAIRVRFFPSRPLNASRR